MLSIEVKDAKLCCLKLCHSRLLKALDCFTSLRLKPAETFLNVSS